MGIETSLAVQLLRLSASNAGGTALLPDWGPKIPHALQGRQKSIFFLKYRNRFIKKKIIGIDFLWCSVDISPPEREGISFVGKLYFGG